MPTWTSRIKGHDSNEPPPQRGKAAELERRAKEHAEILKSIARMRELTGELKEELEQTKQHVLSLKALERLEEIMKLSSETRRRLRR